MITLCVIWVRETRWINEQPFESANEGAKEEDGKWDRISVCSVSTDSILERYFSPVCLSWSLW